MRLTAPTCLRTATAAPGPWRAGQPRQYGVGLGATLPFPNLVARPRRAHYYLLDLCYACNLLMLVGGAPCSI